MRNDSVSNVWPKGNQALRPIVITWTPDQTLTSVGASGDISLSFSETILWADVSDHSQTYGVAVNGFWQWYLNLFPAFDFPGGAGYTGAFGPTVQSGTLSLTLDLLDAASSVLTSASTSASYSVDLTSIFSFTYSLSTAQPICGSEQILEWNAVRVRCSCSNTNLNLLLNYGAFGISGDPSVSVYWPSNPTFVEKIAAL
jgi:hypothetical protein